MPIFVDRFEEELKSHPNQGAGGTWIPYIGLGGGGPLEGRFFFCDLLKKSFQ
jgi:hypothetical protein